MKDNEKNNEKHVQTNKYGIHISNTKHEGSLLTFLGENRLSLQSEIERGKKSLGIFL
jgi:hypothetical protein